MFNSKLRLLICLILLFTVNINASHFDLKNFQKNYDYVKFNIKAAVNNLKYVETVENYNHYFKENILNNSIDCFKRHKKFFYQAFKKYKVSPYVILSILTIESHCGKHVSKYNLVESYKSLITLKLNKRVRNKIYKQIIDRYPKTDKKWFLRRVDRKYKWAKKQLKALKLIYLKDKIDVFQVRSSWAGAFGLPQFIPTTFLNFAVDGDNDKKIDIFKIPDSVFSIANYLSKNGWKEKAKKNHKKRVVFTYNHSKLYCDTVIKLSEIFEKRLK